MKYVHHDGSLHPLLCHCGLEPKFTPWKDGVRTLECPNGHRLGIYFDEGSLDLGIVQEAETPVIDQ